MRAANSVRFYPNCFCHEVNSLHVLHYKKDSDKTIRITLDEISLKSGALHSPFCLFCTDILLFLHFAQKTYIFRLFFFSTSMIYISEPTVLSMLFPTGVVASCWSIYSNKCKMQVINRVISDLPSYRSSVNCIRPEAD